jgi:hypothetical protein
MALGEDNGRQAKREELIRLEYANLTAQFVANEEMGERRVALLVTLTAGLGAAAGFAHEKLGGQGFPELWLGVNVAWLLFGYLTFLRILKRNKATDFYKARLRALRQWFVEAGDEELRRKLPFDPWNEERESRAGLRFRMSRGGTGGYAELVAFVNSMTAGALGWQVSCLLLQGMGLHFAILRLACLAVTALSAWLWWRRQATLAERYYEGR